MNNVQILGRLTNDPMITETKEHLKARITIAVDGTNEHTNFIPVVAWDKRAEMIEKYLKKGMKIAVTGAIYTYDYDKDGEKKYGIEITADHIDFCESKKTTEESSEEIEEKPKKGGYKRSK